MQKMDVARMKNPAGGAAETSSAGSGVPGAPRPRSEQESTTDIIERLDREEPDMLQMIRRQVIDCLLTNAARNRSMSSLGRTLTDDTRRWMRKHRLSRLSCT
eukprot:TRINITY_DN52721_c0_g1_i2.p1 TRINITY_DN52721_c0_g1~~TRINITY_DN52721_c0_g1_i2.p1  ORF type:complete len:102 (+),score=8.12 TRINITY_DN52721_c0_g1_i2:144-449(+)